MWAGWPRTADVCCMHGGDKRGQEKKAQEMIMTALGKSLSIWQIIGSFTWWGMEDPGNHNKKIVKFASARRSATKFSELLHVICLTLRHPRLTS